MHAGTRLSLAFAALLTALPAAAQPADPVAATALFREGRDALKRGDFAAACPKLAESYRLDPAPGTLVNLADCEEHVGKVASAWQHYVLATEKLEAGDDRLPFVSGRLSAIASRVPKLTLRIARGAPEGTTVTRDGIALGPGSLGTALPTDPGEHSVEARAPGYAPNTVSVTLVEGEQRQLDVKPGAALPPGAASPSEPTDVPRPRGIGVLGVVGIVTGGLGVVGLGVAISTGLVLRGKADTAAAGCPAPTFVCSTNAAYQTAQSGLTLTPINTAAWIAGALATAAGVTLVVVDRVKDRPASVGLRVLPGGAVVTGTF